MQCITHRSDRKFSAGNLLIPLLAVFLYIIVQIFVTVAAILPRQMHNIIQGNWQADLARDMAHQSSLILLVSAVLHILIFSALLIGFRRRGKPYVFHRFPQKEACFLFPLFGLGALGLSMLWMYLCQFLAQGIPLFHHAIEVYQELMQSLQAQGSGDWLINLLAVGVLVPIAEELLFRGVLISEWKLCMPKSLAILLSALLFGIFHGNLIQSGYAFLLGLVLGVLYVWTESILYPILLHMFFNLIGGCLADALQQMGERGAFWMFALTLIQLGCFLLAIVGAVWFYPRRRAARTIAKGSVTDLQPLELELQVAAEPSNPASCSEGE